MFTPAGLAGLLLALGAGGSVVAAVRAGGTWRRFAPAIAAGALAFQLVHVLEHALQVLVWMGDPGARPWMSPWAHSTAQGVGEWFAFLAPVAGTGPLGMELLHLLGNVIFLSGLVVLVGLPGFADSRRVRIALATQAVHVFEHVLLTLTLATSGAALGVSTELDQVLPVGPSTTRVLFHFAINAVATAYAVAAVRAAGWRPRAGAERSTSVGTDRIATESDAA